MEWGSRQEKKRNTKDKHSRNGDSSTVIRAWHSPSWINFISQKKKNKKKCRKKTYINWGGDKKENTPEM